MAENAAGETSTLARVRLHESTLVRKIAAHDGDGFGLYDLAIDAGRIAAITPSTGELPAVDEQDMGGRIILPAFVDCHTHLDKGHIWPRRPNPDGTFDGALASVSEDRAAFWTAGDVDARMNFSLKCAYAYGTKAIRTHLDSAFPQETISWPVFEAVRERWAGRIDLQASCLIGIEQVRETDWYATLVARVKAAGGILGTVTYMVPDVEELLDRVFAAAIDNDLELDFHADETGDTAAVTLRLIAEAAARNRFEKPILIGHCCALARQPDDEVRRTLDLVAGSTISVVSLPMCNLYLQDRRPPHRVNGGTTPRWRGVTLLHEMAARGVNVCVASDNTRDPFYAYGDLDMLEVYRMATRIIHFDHPVGNWPKTVFANAARAMSLDGSHGMLRAGDPADFILFKGRSWTELLSRPESDRVVYRDGKAIAARLPDYAELDHLMEHTS